MKFQFFKVILLLFFINVVGGRAWVGFKALPKMAKLGFLAQKDCTSLLWQKIKVTVSRLPM